MPMNRKKAFQILRAARALVYSFRSGNKVGRNNIARDPKDTGFGRTAMRGFVDIFASSWQHHLESPEAGCRHLCVPNIIVDLLLKDGPYE
jgi:hypothetical protein